MDETLPQSTPNPMAVLTRADQLLELIHWTSAVGRQMRRCLVALCQTAALTDSELLAIWLCLQSESGLVQGELAAAIGVSPAQMSGIVERLRQRGLIEMHRQTLDRRCQVWRGTSAARQVLESLALPLANLTGWIEACIPTADQQATRELCRRLTSAAAAWPTETNDNGNGNMMNPPASGSPRKAA